MKNKISLLFAALIALAGCTTQTATYPESISGGHVFTYDDDIRSAAFEMATIYIDSGYLSLVHVNAIEDYLELLKKGEWEADRTTLHFVVCAYQIAGDEIPIQLNEFIEPDYIENNQRGVQVMKSQIDQLLHELKRLEPVTTGQRR